MSSTLHEKGPLRFMGVPFLINPLIQMQGRKLRHLQGSSRDADA